MRRRLRPLMFLGAALTIAGGTGLALAQIPGPDGVIHACYKKKSGNLRVVEGASDCRKREISLQWNAEGRPGPPGPPGPAGLGKAYTTGFEFPGVLLPAPGGDPVPVTLLSLNVSAGKYVVHATVQAANETQLQTFLKCGIVGGLPASGVGAFVALEAREISPPLPDPQGSWATTVPVTRTITFTEPGQIQLFCAAYTDQPGASIRALGGDMTAVAVSELIVQPGT